LASLPAHVLKHEKGRLKVKTKSHISTVFLGKRHYYYYCIIFFFKILENNQPQRQWLVQITLSSTETTTISKFLLLKLHHQFSNSPIINFLSTIKKTQNQQNDTIPFPKLKFNLNIVLDRPKDRSHPDTWTKRLTD